MATTSTRRSYWRSLAAMLVLTLALLGGLAAAVAFRGAQWTPKLGLDLEGGTQMILQPQVRAGQSVNQEQLAQAVDIMRARVDGQGVAEAEVSTLGDNIVVSVPGTLSEEQEEALRQSSQMTFRPVIAVIPNTPTAQAAPSGSPSAPATPGAPRTPTATASAAPSTPGGATPSTATATRPSAGSAGGGMNAGVRAAPTPTPPAATPTPPAATPTPPAATPTPPAATPTPSAPAATPAPTGGGPTGLPSRQPTTPAGPTISDADRRDPRKLAAWATSEAWATPQWQQRVLAYDCADEPAYNPATDDPNQPAVACDENGQAKYLLGPVVASGRDLADASSGPATNDQGVPTGGYEVQLKMRSGEPTSRYAAVSGYMVPLPDPRNQLAVVLDNQVVYAPQFQSAITDGNARITGDYTADSAKQFADQLKFGALPISFSVQSTETVSPTIGGDQLRKGIIAGLIGLALVVVYTLFQYRVLGFVTVASLLLVAALTYLLLTLLGWGYNLRLTMAGVTGAIVAIGTTADSFIVYFERVRDEVREGRRLESAVQTGWDRAKRTVLISDGVNFLAAAVLYVLASSNVRGFAFILMLTTILDVIVTFLFTHPLLSLLARTRFFGDGHTWSGFDPKTLGAKARYMGRGRLIVADRAAATEGSRA